MKSVYLAIDIGASSGRAILARNENQSFRLQEIYRFENGQELKNGHLCWDLEALTSNVLASLKACGEYCRQNELTPVSLGIDTWGVDFVLLDENDRVIGDAVGYRDSRTAGILDELEQSGLLTLQEHYERTGIQYQPYNTVYQLLALKKEHPEQLSEAHTLLMIPDYLNFVLTGVKTNEYTEATTTALVNATTRNWDFELIERLGLPSSIFQKISVPGTALGPLTESVQETVGFNLNVILPCCHDTGSAFLSVPAKDENALFLSSGTWSLLGVENPEPLASSEGLRLGFTNEGGYHYRFRCLKNIMGLWMIQSVRKEIGKETGIKPSFQELIQAVSAYEDLTVRIDVDDPRFLAPVSMRSEIVQACVEQNTPISFETGAILQVIYNSLSDDYARTAKALSQLTGRTYSSINIVGGGSQDQYLNQKTADAANLPVYAGPTEGTALGNIIVQMLCNSEFSSLQEARDAVRRSFEIKEVLPKASCGTIDE